MQIWFWTILIFQQVQQTEIICCPCSVSPPKQSFGPQLSRVFDTWSCVFQVAVFESWAPRFCRIVPWYFRQVDPPRAQRCGDLVMLQGCFQESKLGSSVSWSQKTSGGFWSGLRVDFGVCFLHWKFQWLKEMVVQPLELVWIQPFNGVFGFGISTISCLFWERERERELCMILSLLLHTVDGRNPPPPNLYETL